MKTKITRKEFLTKMFIGLGIRKENDMFIVTQNKKSIVNIDIAFRIVVKGTYIIAITDNDKTSTLGSYETEERANEVFEHIANIIGLGVQRIISMPEE